MRTTTYPPTKPLILTLAILLSANLLCACSDDAGSSQANTNAATNKAADNMKDNAQQGEADKTSFEVEAKDEASGMTTKEENEIEDQNASQANSGASIAGSILSIYLVAPSGSTVTAIVETTESLRAPGSFTVSAPPEGTHVSWLNPLAGQIFSSSAGTITLANCPKVMGDKVKGSFTNVEVTNEIDGSKQTLNGDFDVALYAVSGALFCTEKPVDDMGGNMNNNDMGNNGQTCDATICADASSNCCPYAQCLSTCQFNCLTQDPACNNPFSADPVKCAQCNEACLDSCNVSQECRTAFVELSTCERQAGCDEAADEDAELACSKENCCAELKAAF